MTQSFYPGSGRGGRTSSSGVLKALYYLAPGVPVMGLLQARRERKPGFQVPGVMAGDACGRVGEQVRGAACLQLCRVCVLFVVLSPRGRGARPPFIDQGGSELHARRAT
jgi:hypothetical protein